MSKKKVTNIDFKKFVEIFNSQGKEATVDYVTETYGCKYDTIVRKLRRDSEYIFDPRRDRYILKEGSNPEDAFLSMDELSRVSEAKEFDTESTSHSEVIATLVRDRFFEISNFVTLENSRKRVIFNSSKAKAKGYEIVLI